MMSRRIADMMNYISRFEKILAIERDKTDIRLQNAWNSNCQDKKIAISDIFGLWLAAK